MLCWGTIHPPAVHIWYPWIERFKPFEIKQLAVVGQQIHSIHQSACTGVSLATVVNSWQAEYWWHRTWIRCSLNSLDTVLWCWLASDGNYTFVLTLDRLQSNIWCVGLRDWFKVLLRVDLRDCWEKKKRKLVLAVQPIETLLTLTFSFCFTCT